MSDQPHYLPTPEEIAERAREVREEGFTARGVRYEPWEFGVIRRGHLRRVKREEIECLPVDDWTTARQLADRLGCPLHEAACWLADECRAGRIEGREFNGACWYRAKDEDGFSWRDGASHADGASHGTGKTD